MDSEAINHFILEHWNWKNKDLAEATGLRTDEAVRSRKRALRRKGFNDIQDILPAFSEEDEDPEQLVQHERTVTRLTKDKRTSDKKLKYLVDKIDSLEAEIEAAFDIKSALQSYTIEPITAESVSESTAFLICSDWHIEEDVNPDTVSQLNEFNLAVAKDRVERLFRKAVDFIRMYKQDTEINTLVLALLGDFINGNIHDELKESNHLLPVEATIYAQELITSGIEYILAETSVEIIVPCHSGNHARVTKKVHHGTERGNSLEYYMYHSLRTHFRNEPRVTFIISEGYHSYLKVYGRTIRFHHGHDIKYGGGIGGLFVPAYKAVGAWNKARPAELDVFGHFHQTKDGGSFLCNGSLVGYDAFALSIKADYESPKQSFFLYNKGLGRTIMSPIHL